MLCTFDTERHALHIKTCIICHLLDPKCDIYIGFLNYHEIILETANYKTKSDLESWEHTYIIKIWMIKKY